MKASQTEWRVIPAAFEAPDGLQAVAAFQDVHAMSEYGLAVLAMGLAYWTFRFEGWYVICVADTVARRVREEFSEFERVRARREGIHSAVFHPVPFSRRLLWLFPLLWAVLWATQSLVPMDLRPIGRVDSIELIGHGQWWRCFTALCLHADLPHWLANGVSGFGFMLLVSQIYGSPWSWLMVLLAGGLGNWVNAWLYYPEPHYSIGASTAVFAALGVLTGGSLRFAARGGSAGPQYPAWAIPLVGGLALLGLLGASADERIDVSAHLCGFTVGLAFGVVASMLRAQLLRPGLRQRAAGAAAVLLLVVAWGSALGVAG